MQLIGVIEMDNERFKLNLIQLLEKHVINPSLFNGHSPYSDLSGLDEVVSILPRCEIQLNETNLFTRIEWNTYQTILDIKVPFNKYELFESEKNRILAVAKKIYGKQDDNILTHIEIGLLLENSEIADLSTLKKTETIEKAIDDAELLMSQGKYDSAIDRVHTAFHGYLRNILAGLEVQYFESDTLSQLYSKLHSNLPDSFESEDISQLVKTSARGATGIVSSINDFRNKHSLAHPNESLISKREAEFVIKLIESLSKYINEIVE